MSSVIPTNIESAELFQSPDPDRKQVSGKKDLTPEDFITLFLKQMTTQNPLKPADNAMVLQQMADISAISANKSMQKTLDNLSHGVNQSLANTELLSATQMIGKHAEIPSGSAPLTEDEGLSGSVMVKGPASHIKVMIKNNQGQTVKELQLDDAKSAGLMPFKWDGKGEGDQAVEPGFYQIAATATIDGQDVALDTTGAYKIKSVASDPESGKVILNLDGVGGLELNDIIKLL